MSPSVLYMSMSLDGYIAGPNDEPSNPGDGFDRLHEWFGFAPDGEAGQLKDEYNATGAVLAGRRTVEQVDHWGGDSHGVPIFVVSHRPPGPSVANYPLLTYVTDGIESAMAQAKAAALDRNVLVLGAYTAQRALEAGVLDEVQIHLIPVLFGGAVGCSRSCRRVSLWRSLGRSTRRRPPTFAIASGASAGRVAATWRVGGWVS